MSWIVRKWSQGIILHSFLSGLAEWKSFFLFLHTLALTSKLIFSHDAVYFIHCSCLEVGGLEDICNSRNTLVALVVVSTT